MNKRLSDERLEISTHRIQNPRFEDMAITIVVADSHTTQTLFLSETEARELAEHLLQLLNLSVKERVCNDINRAW